MQRYRIDHCGDVASHYPLSGVAATRAGSERSDRRALGCLAVGRWSASCGRRATRRNMCGGEYEVMSAESAAGDFQPIEECSYV